jgi:hypothetical protein
MSVLGKAKGPARLPQRTGPFADVEQVLAVGRAHRFTMFNNMIHRQSWHVKIP